MKKVKILIVFICTTTICFGQNSIFQDADGESGYKFGDGTQLSVSSGETSINYSIGKLKSGAAADGSQDKGYGLNLKFQSTNGVSTLLDDGQFDPKGSLGFFYLKPLGKLDTTPGAVNKPRIQLMPYFNLALTTATVLDPLQPQNGTSKEDNLNFEVGVSFSKNSQAGTTPIVWGLTINGGIKDNSSKLSVLQFKETVPVANTNFTTESNLKGYSNSDYKSNNGFFNINFDYAIYPKAFDSRFVAAVHYRHNQFDDNSVGKLGAGFYLAKSGSPTDIVGGLNILYNDLYGTLDDFLNNYGNVTINVVAGFNLN